MKRKQEEGGLPHERSKQKEKKIGSQKLFIRLMHGKTKRKNRKTECFNELGLVSITAIISLGSKPVVYVLSRPIGATSPLCRTHKHNSVGGKHKFPQSLHTTRLPVLNQHCTTSRDSKRKPSAQTRSSHIPANKQDYQVLFSCTDVQLLKKHQAHPGYDAVADQRLHRAN